jgi:hypothetical protein
VTQPVPDCPRCGNRLTVARTPDHAFCCDCGAQAYCEAGVWLAAGGTQRWLPDADPPRWDAPEKERTLSNYIKAMDTACDDDPVTEKLPCNKPNCHYTRRIHRYSANGEVLVLCAYGHVYAAIPAREWIGSAMEAAAQMPVHCHGRIEP